MTIKQITPYLFFDGTAEKGGGTRRLGSTVPGTLNLSKFFHWANCLAMASPTTGFR